MKLDQEGRRIVQLQRALETICTIYELANEHGLMSVQFMNAKRACLSFKAKHVPRLNTLTSWDGFTRIGTTLDEKILQRFVPQRRPSMKRPLSIIILTDGDVSKKSFCPERSYQSSWESARLTADYL